MERCKKKLKSGLIFPMQTKTIFPHNSALHRGLSAWHPPPHVPPNIPDTPDTNPSSSTPTHTTTSCYKRDAHIARHNSTKTAGSYFEQVTENTIYRKHCYLITLSWPVSRWRNQQTVLFTLPSVPCVICHQYRVCSAVKLFLFLRQNLLWPSPNQN